MGHVTNIFKLIPYFLASESFRNLNKDILRDESSDELEGNNDSGQESDDDEEEEEGEDEQVHI